MSKSIAVIGAGAWGTALALILAEKNYSVKLWEYFSDYAELLANKRENIKFLPGVKIPDEIIITNDLKVALKDCGVVVIVVPSQRLRSIVQKIKKTEVRPKLIVTASKGIEQNTLVRMSEVVKQEIKYELAVSSLSGPSHAEEVAQGLPCSLVAASKSEKIAIEVQDMFMHNNLRVYTSEDIIGVELGGALKNVIALAVGIVDGLGLGDNTKAALMTRGLEEIRRLGKKVGAKAETFSGLSGMGDLIATCTSLHSRNRYVGERLGRGEKLDEILRNLEKVAEGVDTARAAKLLAEKNDIEMPVVFQVNYILDGTITPEEAVDNLMKRTRKAEIW